MPQGEGDAAHFDPLTGARQHLFLNTIGSRVACQIQLKILLQSEPEFRRCAEITRQPKRHERADPPLFINNPGNVIGRHMESSG